MLLKWRFGLLSLAMAATIGLGGALVNGATAQDPQEHYLAATADTVHWGYFSQTLEPELVVDSGGCN